ncbi:MAG TPA: hypothetical protein VKU19_03790 [Bryobacteraceae bacterium]|nr:hypothetical protein [Bryobacteraceae bacterium]
MRYAALLFVPSLLCAQSVEPDQRVTQALISEIQQLRMAIERSTLLSTRTQLALSQLQIQDGALARLTQQYNDARTSSAGVNARRIQIADAIKDLEQKKNDPGNATPQQREAVDDQVKQLKYELESSATVVQMQSAKESDLAMQLQQAQAQIADTRNRIAEMEKALDAAIQQLLQKK